MLRRVAIVVLIAVVSTAVLSTCPRPVSACAMSFQARHGCCEHVAVRQAPCCCGSNQRLPQLVSTAGPIAHAQGVRLVSVAARWQPEAAVTLALRVSRAAAGHRPAPPDTPIHNHTRLLL